MSRVQWMIAVACCSLSFLPTAVAAQTAISNPLIRPVYSAPAPAQAEPVPAAREEQRAARDDELRSQAERRITQEDFNLRQQTLNAAQVPSPLSNMFRGLVVTALLDNTVVLRRITTSVQTVETAAAAADPNNPEAQRGARGSMAVAEPSMSSALRLRLNQNINVNGYVVRAIRDGLDIRVDWMGERGWVTVYLGALESGQAPANTPRRDTLEKVETDAFKYLEPSTSEQFGGNRGIGSNVGGGGGFPNTGFGGQGGFNQPQSPNSFGTGF